MDAITTQVLDTLRAYDTPTICNIIELFDIQPRTVGYMNRTIKAAFPELPPLVGFASTVTCRTAIRPRGRDAYTVLPDQVERFVELDGPAVVVFQDLDGENAAATFGEIMCTTYRVFGAAGLITSGPGRDLDQVRQMTFPVFTDGSVCSHGYIRILDVHVPVVVGGIAVYPNDLIHADVNGVVIIPREIAAAVAGACEEYVAAEQAMLAVLNAPSVTLERLRAAAAEKDIRTIALQQRLVHR